MHSILGTGRTKEAISRGFWALAISLWAAAPLIGGDSKDKQTLQRAQDFEHQFQDGGQQRGTILERMRAHGVPGVSIAVIQDRELAWTKGYGLISANGSQPVDRETVFSVGSVSKLATAVVTLRLVAKGKLNLDADVNQFLSRWKAPPTPFTDQQPVTLRHIMSHTAGFTVHGFPDFQPGESLPTTLDTLHGRSPAKHGPVVVDFTPGTQYRYSGGGTTVQQLIIEEITGQNYPAAARQLVFEPLAMTRSTFENPIPAQHGNIARAHGRLGQPTALPRGWEAMPEMAASGLWTTSGDLAKVLIALIKAHDGQGDGFLKQSLVQDMMTKVPPGEFGLGPHLYQDHVFGHGGSNNSYKAQAMANLKSGNGIVVLTNGANGKKIIHEIIETMKRIEGW